MDFDLVVVYTSFRLCTSESVNIRPEKKRLFDRGYEQSHHSGFSRKDPSRRQPASGMGKSRPQVRRFSSGASSERCVLKPCQRKPSRGGSLERIRQTILAG
jgi:hypothetical protein